MSGPDQTSTLQWIELSFVLVNSIQFIIWSVGLALIMGRRKQHPRACRPALRALALFMVAGVMSLADGALQVAQQRRPETPLFSPMAGRLVGAFRYAVFPLDWIAWGLLIAAFLAAIKPPAVSRGSADEGGPPG